MTNLITEVLKRIDDHYRARNFQATVVTYAAGPPKSATVRRNGQATADGQSYVVLAHVPALVAGDVVYLSDSTGNGTPVVVGKVSA